MRAEDIKHYPLFIFTSEDFCLQTADYRLLKFIFDANDKKIETDFEIGKIITFRMDDDSRRKFKISNISIRNVVEHTELNRKGVISYGCMNTSGEPKEEPMFLHIELTEINT